MTADPLRLLQDPATAAVLRRDLSTAACGVPYDVGAGLARFEASLSQGAGTAVGSARFSGASGPLAVGGLLLIGGLAAALGWALAAPEPTPAALGGRELATTPMVSSPMPMPPPVVPNVVPAVSAVEVSTPSDVIAEVAPAPRPAKTRRPKGARNEVSAVKDGGSADYLREARSVNLARGQLGQNAAQAFALAEAGSAEFKDGTFAQEWEGIAVLALFELGRRDEARARAESFLQRYPSGTYAPRIRQARDEGLP